MLNHRVTGYDGHSYGNGHRFVNLNGNMFGYMHGIRTVDVNLDWDGYGTIDSIRHWLFNSVGLGYWNGYFNGIRTIYWHGIGTVNTNGYFNANLFLYNNGVWFLNGDGVRSGNSNGHWAIDGHMNWHFNMLDDFVGLGHRYLYLHWYLYVLNNFIGLWYRNLDWNLHVFNNFVGLGNWYFNWIRTIDGNMDGNFDLLDNFVGLWHMYGYFHVFLNMYGNFSDHFIGLWYRYLNFNGYMFDMFHRVRTINGYRNWYTLGNGNGFVYISHLTN